MSDDIDMADTPTALPELPELEKRNYDLDYNIDYLGRLESHYRSSAVVLRDALEKKGIGSKAVRNKLADEYANDPTLAEIIDAIVQLIEGINIDRPEILPALRKRVGEISAAIDDNADAFVQDTVSKEMASSDGATHEQTASATKFYEAVREQFARCQMLFKLSDISESTESWGDTAVLRGAGGERESFVPKIPRMPGEKRERKARTPNGPRAVGAAKESGVVYVHNGKVLALNPLSALRALKLRADVSVKQFLEDVTGEKFTDVSSAKDSLLKYEPGLIGTYAIDATRSFYAEDNIVSVYRTVSKYTPGDSFTN